jgi:glycosyltransferase involved in cell wall biosynthesis
VSPTVTVAIPVLNGAALLDEVLSAVRSQDLDRGLELLVVDSGSTDGSREIAHRHGARVHEIGRREFSHGRTRDLLMELAQGAHVAFLTQDATPADAGWLCRLLEAFDIGSDVGLAFGPYRPRPGAAVAVRRELDEWFSSFSPGGAIVVDRLTEDDPWPPSAKSRMGFYTSANGCLARWAWERVRFGDVSYAEDRLLSSRMLRAGIAKAFVPQAAVVHSHDHPPLAHFRRCFDEWRGLREVLGHVEQVGMRRTLGAVRSSVRDDRAYMRRVDGAATPEGRELLRSLGYHASRAAGAALGSRADRLPPALRRVCSLERRSGYEARGPTAATAKPLA